MSNTSGTYNRQMTAEQMVQAAAEELGYVAAGEQVTGDDLNLGIRSLNFMLKSLTSRGANLWREDVQSVTLPAGLAGVLLDDSIENVQAAGCVTLQGFVREMQRYERGSFGLPFGIGTSGFPLGYYVDRQRDAAMLYVWPVPRADAVIYMDVLLAIQDVTQPDDAVDVPVKWTEAIYCALAARLAAPFGVTRTDAATVQRVEQRAAAFEQLLLNEDRPASIYMGASAGYIGGAIPRYLITPPSIILYANQAVRANSGTVYANGSGL